MLTGRVLLLPGWASHVIKEKHGFSNSLPLKNHNQTMHSSHKCSQVAFRACLFSSPNSLFLSFVIWRVLGSSNHVSKPQHHWPWKFRDHFLMLTYCHIGTMEWPTYECKNIHVEESSNLGLFTRYPNIHSSLLSGQSFAHHSFSIKLSSFLCRMQNVIERTLDCKFQVLHIKVSSALTSCVALEKWLTFHK